MEYFPASSIMEEIDRWLKSPTEIDFITLSGSGEPTLHTGLGDIIEHVKKITSIPIAVLTNGALFFDSRVREEVSKADLIIPSLDCGDEEMFQRINRPHENISFQELVEGLIHLREEYRGRIWLEVFLVKGINTIGSQVEKISSWAKRIRPDKVQLNTVDRPPAEAFVGKPSKEELLKISKAFNGDVEILSSLMERKLEIDTKRVSSIPDVILSILRRRPCRIGDLLNGLEVERGEILNHISLLIGKGLIEEKYQDGEIFYRIKERCHE
jgi:wyosine [tRNA(Phe)-imidazoG37] synthetase (radical SAM superfamily)